MPSPETIEIAGGPFKARFAPASGGRMAYLAHASLGDILVPTPPIRFDGWNWPRAGAYPLFPYHNRLAGAVFTHSGKSYRVVPHPALDGDAMHGPAHRRVWCVAEHAPNRLSLTLDYAADDEWPFSFEARQVFTLDADGLTVELGLTNRAAEFAPAAIGWHPYFAASLDQRAETDAGFALPLDALNVPTGATPESRASHVIPASSGYTLHFTDWTMASLSKEGGRIVLTADPIFAHLAVHRMDRYLCLEPVSAAAGVLALPEERRTATGLALLAPGERLSGRIRLSIENPEGGARS